MTSDFGQFSAKWSELHGGAAISGIVGYWLRASYRLAKVMSKLQLTANSLTSLGLIFAAATAIYSPHWLGALFIALSLLCDGLDGPVAILQGKASRMGAIYDAIADRLSEALWMVALYRLGVGLAWVLTLGALAAFQEYARARLGAAGFRQIGVVTPSERPVRASLVFAAIVAWQFTFSNGWVLGITILATLLQLVSFILVISLARRSLK